MRSKPGQSPADFLREQGWECIVLRGGPLIRDGREVEKGRIAVVTAIGERAVLGKVLVDGGSGWTNEHMLVFDVRDWWVNGEEPDDAAPGGAS